eukprot:TRINITY_DN2495_c0_g2_i1.p1 TRINITY_DN2495_c0_g2~~TRINITY_DN2495_c0_g2_i1.p1  ORF type:complete len:114 (+),score=26.31 TRINITY_DN2495_c0_g2_i1:149-490(+)
MEEKAENEVQPTILPATQRSDGTWRKPVKVRPGFVPKEEIQRYVPPFRREIEDTAKNPKTQKMTKNEVPAPGLYYVKKKQEESVQSKQADDKEALDAITKGIEDVKLLSLIHI